MGRSDGCFVLFFIVSWILDTGWLHSQLGSLLAVCRRLSVCGSVLKV
jgi:hypothetical protein